MTRMEVLRDIEGTLGMVPAMFEALPDDTLEPEWMLFKRVQLEDDIIPAKYRELIGLAVGAAVGNQYCVTAHREFAKAFGATDEELEGAVRLAKGVAGWGTYLAGTGIGLETVRKDVGQLCNLIRAGGRKEAPQSAGVVTH